LKRFKQWLSKKPYLSTDGQLIGKDVLDGMVLAIGLFLRDVHYVHFLEPDSDTAHLPIHISNSTLGLSDQDVALNTCDNILELIQGLADTGR
jgi:hypothetical protein